MNNLLVMILGLFALSSLIVIHEFGHLIVGIWLKASPKTFAIGFGKSIFSKQIKGVNFKINMIPMGGYVDFNTTQFPQIETSKTTISYWKWILIAFAGPLFNFLTTWFLLFILTVKIFSSVEIYKAPKITEKNIIKIDTVKDLEKANFSKFIFLHKDLLYKNKNDFIKIDLLLLKKDHFSIFEVFQYSFVKSIESFIFISQQYIKGVSQLFKKSEYQQLSGPIGIVSQFKNHSNSLTEILSFVCLLSFAIGFFNLLPFFTILDGGRIVIALCQTIFGDLKFINKLTIQMNAISLTMFFIIFIYTTVGDILKLF